MKGQAAVEYLTTYGWAILVLLIVTAVLFASGIMSPTYLISEECTFGNNIGCNFALFNEGGASKLNLELRNGFPYKIKVTSVSIATQDGLQEFSGFAAQVEIDSGASHTFKGTLGGPAVTEGTVKRFTGNITYVSCAPELGPDCSILQHILTGRVVGKVIPQ